MRKLNIWGFALAAVVVSGAVAATSIAPALTRADGEENAVNYVLDPESGSYVKDLQVINITFDKKGVQISEDAALPIVLKNTETGAEYLCEYPDVAPRAEQGITSFDLKFLTPAQEEGQSGTLEKINIPGNYELTISEGVFVYGDEVEDENQNVTLTNVTPVEAITASYTIAEPLPEVAYTLDPESGKELTELQQVTITFKDLAQGQGIEVNAKTASITLKNLTTGDEYNCTPVQDGKVAEGIAFTLQFTSSEADDEDPNALELINIPGAYELTIAEGAFLYGDEVTENAGTEEEKVVLDNVAPVQEIKATYTIVSTLPQVAYTLDPADGDVVKELQKITVTFTGLEGKGIEVNPRNSLAVTLKNISSGNGEEYTCVPVQAGKVAEGIAFILDFTATEAETEDPSLLEAITTPGAYELTIPQGAFLYGDEVTENAGTDDETVTLENLTSVQEIKAMYTVAEPGPQTAYTLDPEDGAYVNEIGEIILSFPTVKGMQPGQRQASNIVLTNVATNAEYVCDEVIPNTHAEEGSVFTLKFHPVDADTDVEGYVWHPITEPGMYQLSIKGGSFYYGEEVEGEDGVTVPEQINVQPITALYTIVEPLPQVEYVLDPVDGAELPELQRVTINFPVLPEGVGMIVNERRENSVILTNTLTGEEYYCTPVQDAKAAEGISFTLDFTSSEADPEDPNALELINIPGIYELTIAQGAFLYGEEEIQNEGTEEETLTFKSLTPVQEIKATYTIVSTLPQVEYILNPENGATVTDLQRVTVTFPELKGKGVEVNERMLDSIILKNVDTDEEYTCAPYMADDLTEGPAFILDFISTLADPEDPNALMAIDIPGSYELIIPQGAFLYGDEVIENEGTEEEILTLKNITPVQAISATYTILSTVEEVAYILNPANGEYVEDLQRVTISFPELKGKGMEANPKMAESIVLKNIETSEEYNCEPYMGEDLADGPSFILEFISSEAAPEELENALVPITTPGTYKLIIPQGALLYFDEEIENEGTEEETLVQTNITPVQAIYATYIISTSGVNGVFGEEATEFDVYGINGIQILKAADSDAVNALPAGLYIINGKKVIKK